MALASGHTWEEMDPEEKEQLEKDFTGSLNKDMIILQPGGWLVSKLWLNFQERIYNFKVIKMNDKKVLSYGDEKSEKNYFKMSTN